MLSLHAQLFWVLLLLVMYCLSEHQPSSHLAQLYRVLLFGCVQCGPRFELKPYQVKLGTVDQAHAENEWVLRAYTRSSKKAKLAVPDQQ